MSSPLYYFSNDYYEATKRIHQKALEIGLEHVELDIYDDLKINIYHRLCNGDMTFLLNSGLHGVEGYLGSALQLAFLDNIKIKLEVNLILIHISNPFGMIHSRRWNKNNVDLNRNFWSEPIKEPNPAYNKISHLINPSNENNLSYFKPKAFLNILKYGFKPLQQAIAQGQYENDLGIFYGGKLTELETRMIKEYLSTNIPEDSELFGIDIHCGLGKYGQETLLLESSLDSNKKHTIGTRIKKEITQVQANSKNNYEIKGGFINWISEIIGLKQNNMITLEIGTSKPLQILDSLRSENFYYNHSNDSLLLKNHQERVKENFFPNNDVWKTLSIDKGLLTILNYYNSL